MKETENTQHTDVAPDKTHGFWLTAFLILMFIANPFTAYLYFTNPDVITTVYPKATTGLLYFMGVMALVNVVLAAGVWMWRKWGVMGLYIMAGMAFVINIYIGLDLVSSSIGLAGPLILFLTTRSRWQHFT